MDVVALATQPHVKILTTVIELVLEALESSGETDEETLIRKFNLIQANLIKDLSELCPPEHYSDFMDYWNGQQAKNFREVQQWIDSKITDQ